jgi:carboxyl-terminal processing protease
MKNKKNIIFILLASFLISGFVSSYFEITKNLEIFNNIYREINTYYVDPVDPGELMHSTIDTMLKRLDPYTKYIPESEIEDFRFQTTGDYGGIGATIRKVDTHVVIYEPYKGFPADKAGLVMGDKLLEIDDQELINSSTENVSDLLKGTPGTSVNVKVMKNNGEIKIAQITREKIHVSSVPYAGFLDQNIGYVKLNRFTKNCTQEVEEAIQKLEAQEKLKSIILDLRSNPGGLLNESIKLTNLFIPQNETVVTTNGKNTEWKKDYKTKLPPKYENLPIIVLVNGASASASEIVAGAIQDLDRGVIIGNKTYGKGLVQQSRKLSYNSRLKVTVAKYYTPSGRCIQDAGKTKKYNSYLESGNSVDSLRNKFFTKKKRIVYDGGGIDPDIKIEPKEYPDILIGLIRDNHIFKFGNTVVNNLPQYNSVNNFSLTDEIYQEFINYLNGNEFEFASYSDDIIEMLESSLSELEKEGFKLDKINENINRLKADVKSQKKEDLNVHEEIIKNHLSANLITRSFYQAGKIEYSLKDDPYILEALSILNNEKEYNEILTPSTISFKK